MSQEKIEKIVKIGDKEVILSMPTIRQSGDADLLYSKAYVEAIRGGLKPKSSLEKEYREAGILNTADDEELEKSTRRLHELIATMRGTKTEEERLALYSEYTDLKSQYEVALIQRNFLFQHSAEAKAETAKITNLVSQCVLNSDRTRLWKNEEELTNSRNSPFIEDILKEFVLFISGLDDAEAKLEDIINKFLLKPEDAPIVGDDVPTLS